MPFCQIVFLHSLHFIPECVDKYCLLTLFGQGSISSTIFNKLQICLGMALKVPFNFNNKCMPNIVQTTRIYTQLLCHFLNVVYTTKNRLNLREKLTTLNTSISNLEKLNLEKWGNKSYI